MAKYIHVMIRVADENRSKAFYEKAFGFQEAARFPFETFALVYLLDKESGTELELTVNHDRKEPYTHGDGYGHIAMAVDDLEAEHKRHKELGYQPTDIKEFHPRRRVDGEVLLRAGSRRLQDRGSAKARAISVASAPSWRRKAASRDHSLPLGRYGIVPATSVSSMAWK